MVHTATISSSKWLKKQVYHRSDMPPTPISYQLPATPLASPSASPTALPPVNPGWFQGDDVMSMSLNALREIFTDLNPSRLSNDLVACLASNADAIATNHAAYSVWEQQYKEIKIPPQLPHKQFASIGATQNSFPTHSKINFSHSGHIGHPLSLLLHLLLCLLRPQANNPQYIVLQFALLKTNPHNLICHCRFVLTQNTLNNTVLLEETGNLTFYSQNFAHKQPKAHKSRINFDYN